MRRSFSNAHATAALRAAEIPDPGLQIPNFLTRWIF